MNVAIIGAGAAGLACAHELQRLGIIPEVFEKRSNVADYYMNTVAAISFFDKKEKTGISPVKELEKDYNLSLKHKYAIKEIVLKSPGKSASFRGELGVIFERGREGNTLEVQLESKLAFSINYTNYADVSGLKKDFDYVVVATGEESVAKELNIWTETVNAQVRVANILGSFDTSSLTLWLDTEYAGHGYAYLIPNNGRQANLALIHEYIRNDEIDDYWRCFLNAEKLDYSIIEARELRISRGYVEKAQIGNVLLIGAAGGFTDDLLGFGTIDAVKSGVLAARAIAGNVDYELLVSPLRKKIRKMNRYRRYINSFDNNDYDRLVAALGARMGNNAEKPQD